jgi:phage-related protein
MTPVRRPDREMKSRSEGPPATRRRWRDYETLSGRKPVKEFIDKLSDADAAAVLAGMEDVRHCGLRVARHLDGDIWEVRADGDRAIYRVLFAQEGRHGQILLALEAFNKKTRKTPPLVIELANRRLADWRRRGTNGVASAASVRRIDSRHGGYILLCYPQKEISVERSS